MYRQVKVYVRTELIRTHLCIRTVSMSFGDLEDDLLQF